MHHSVVHCGPLGNTNTSGYWVPGTGYWVPGTEYWPSDFFITTNQCRPSQTSYPIGATIVTICRSRGVPTPTKATEAAPGQSSALFDNRKLRRLAGVRPLPKSPRKSLILKYFTYKSFKLKDFAGFSL